MTKREITKPPMESAEDLFREHEPVLKQQAAKFASRTQYETEELLSESYVLFMRAYSNWHVNDGPFKPWLRKIVWNGFVDLHRKAGRSIKNYADVEKLTSPYVEWCPTRRLQFKEFLESLSVDALYVTEVLLDSPTEVLDMLWADTSVGLSSNTYVTYSASTDSDSKNSLNCSRRVGHHST